MGYRSVFPGRGTWRSESPRNEKSQLHRISQIFSHIYHRGVLEKTSLHTFDIHALVERFLFDSFQVNAELHTTLSLLNLPKDAVIAFPDDGADKRFHEAFPGHDRIICAKVREGEKRIITIKEGNPAGKDIVIVDDLIQRLVELEKRL